MNTNRSLSRIKSEIEYETKIAPQETISNLCVESVNSNGKFANGNGKSASNNANRDNFKQQVCMFKICH